MVCGTRASSFYQVLELEVRANLVYREFTRVGAEKVPALGPEAVARTHEFIVTIAQEKQVIAGRQMRVYTTVVETNIHYPTDGSLFGDGVRVLTRTMKPITQTAGQVGTKLRDRTRAVRNKLREIERASRSRQSQGQERMKALLADNK